MKRSLFQSGWVFIPVLSLLCILCFSFVLPGGDHFEVYVNNKMIHQQFEYKKEKVNTLNLVGLRAQDKVGIYYSHCGNTGKGRSITLRNGDNKVLKTWTFADATGKSVMHLEGKDILGLQKSSPKLKIYYASRELPNGKLIAAIEKEGEKTASLR